MDNTKPTITVTVKSVYGEDKIYPVCDKAKQYATLVGQKTLTPRDISVIKLLGHAITVQQPTVAGL